MPTEKTPQFTLRLPPYLYEQVRLVAVREHRSITRQFIAMLEEALRTRGISPPDSVDKYPA